MESHQTNSLVALPQELTASDCGLVGCESYHLREVVCMVSMDDSLGIKDFNQFIIFKAPVVNWKKFFKNL